MPKLGLKHCLLLVAPPRSGATSPLSNFYWTLLIFWPPGNKVKDWNFSYFPNFTVLLQNMWKNAASISWKIRRALRFRSLLPADIWALLSARSSLSEAASVWLISNSIFRKNNCEVWQEFSLTLRLKPNSPPALSREQLSVLVKHRALELFQPHAKHRNWDRCSEDTGHPFHLLRSLCSCTYLPGTFLKQ